MNDLFYVYIVICLFGVLFSIFDINRRVGYFIFLIAFCFFSIVARNSELKVDMINYSIILNYDWSTYFNMYYLKEPFYWFFSKILFEYVGVDKYVFILFDLISMFLFVFLCYKKEVKPYFVFLFFCFFVSIMGFQNIYRQYLATFFIFSSIFLVDLDSKFSFLKRSLLMFFGFITHNVSALFFPVLFSGDKRFGGKLQLFISVVVFVLIWYFLDSKSFSETGEVNPLFFLLSLSFLFFSFLVINRLVINKNNIYFFKIFTYLILLSFFCYILMGQAQLKRVVMIGLAISIYVLYRTIETKFINNDVVVVRLLFFIIMVLPCFIFSSVKNFLMV